MAGCDTFNVSINQDLDVQVKKIRSLIEESGGRFDGDTQDGTFSGKVSPFGSFQGTYEVDENVITIRITQKPFAVPCSSIESRIRNYLK